MNQDMWIDIARTGTFAASSGERVTFTSELFDKLVNGFDEENRRVPLVFGHPQTNAPAYGWIEALRRVGTTLQAKFKQVHEDVKTLVRNGNFKNISISLSSDRSFLHHVGLLGAAQPAIPGLREVTFADSAGYLTFEFSREGRQDEITKLEGELAALRKKWDEQEHRAALTDEEAQRSRTTKPETREDADDQDDEISRLKAELAALRAQLEEQLDRDAKQGKADKLERFKRTVNQGKVSPAEFASFLPFVTALLDSGPMLTFAAGEAPKHAVDALAEILEARPINPIFQNFGLLVHPLHAQPNEDARTAKDSGNPAYLI